MSSLPVDGRDPSRGRGQTVRWSIALATAAAAWLAAGTAAEAAAGGRKVLAVVTCDSYADLKKQFGWLGAQVGQPGLTGMLESVLLMATQGRGLGGFDMKRPLGVVVTTDGGDLAVHGFVPVKSLDKLLESLQAVTGPTRRAGDTRSLVLPNGIGLDAVEKDGWAIVSPQGMDAEAVDPGPLFAPLAENYTLGIELFPHLLPDSLRQQLRMLLAQAAAGGGEPGQQLDPRAILAAVDGLADIESLALGLAIDADKDRLFIENRTVAVPGSAAAAAMTGSDRGQSTVCLPAAADGGRPAIRGHLVQSVPEASREEVLVMLDRALPVASIDPLTKTIAVLLRELISSVLATGGIDAAVCIDTAGGGDRPLPVVTAGVRVKEGAALEASVKRSLGGGQRQLPPGVDIAFDTGKVGATSLHTITVDLRGSDSAESFGDSLPLTLAIAPDCAFLLAGGDARQRLTAVLDAAARPDPDAKPIAGLDVAVRPLLAYAAARGALPATALPDAAATDGDSRSGDVRLLVRPVERGVATRLSATGAALRVLAAGATSGAAAPNGPAIPPGLPLPEGFPIPAPAR